MGHYRDFFEMKMSTVVESEEQERNIHNINIKIL